MSKAHNVKQSDTLSAIAVRYLGASSKWTSIVGANPQLSSRKKAVDGSPLIFPGDTLIIPENETEKPASAKTKKTIVLSGEAEQDVSIVIGGKKFTGFTGYELNLSYDSFDTFSFSAPYGSGGFIGCECRVINVSDGKSAVDYGGTEKTLKSGEELSLEWNGTAWQVRNDGAGSVNTPDGFGQYQEGRNLLEVLGVESPAEAMTVLKERCNNGATAANGEPDFSGLQIGDYIPGIDLSAIPAENGGTAGQAYSAAYRNNDIVISGFNTYLGAGDTENTKNHILFTFKNCPINKRMNSGNDNTGGYKASEIRAFLEGVNGDGTGDKSGVTTAAFMNALKAQIGDCLYTIRKSHSVKSSNAWNNYTVFLPSEIEVFGTPYFGDEGVFMPAITTPAIAARVGYLTNVHFPIFQKSYKHRIKRANGARQWWWEQTPYAAAASNFCHVNANGNATNFLCSVAKRIILHSRPLVGREKKSVKSLPPRSGGRKNF